MTENRVNALVERLLQINWTERADQRVSQALLMEEYLRRSALWAKEYSGGWLFSDVAAMVDPAVRASPEALQRIESGLPIWVNSITRRTIEYALHFAALSDAGAPLPDLPNPFEPLMLLFERGNIFSRDGAGFIDVDFLGIRRGRLSDHLKDEPRAPETLAELDELDWAELAKGLERELPALPEGAQLMISEDGDPDHRRHIRFVRDEGGLVATLAVDDSPEEEIAAGGRRPPAPAGASHERGLSPTSPQTPEQIRALADAVIVALRKWRGVTEPAALQYRAWQSETGEKIYMHKLRLKPEMTE
ncbi:TY-Chap domain-containing protein [Actinomadura sp. 9N215]|uniref:TY-Chap domain-containing protein n=1 Tax=Actinomadura sp. 9N215 TaxID=3375150 RepID=UPI0037BB34EA